MTENYEYDERTLAYIAEIDELCKAEEEKRLGDRTNHQGFIQIEPGLWYCEADGTPWSTKRNLGRGHGWDSYGQLRRLTSKNKGGYYMVNYRGKIWLWHRVVFHHFHGFLPKYIDHINGIRNDNIIANLRECSRSQNNSNRRSIKGSSSKYLGVSWHKSAKKWIAQICISGKKKNLGSFTDEIEAAKAYDAAAREIHGDFANPNFPEDYSGNN